MPSSPLSGDAATILSPESALALREAFRCHLSDPSSVAAVDVRAALAQVCAEARRENIPAERLLIAFKDIWGSLPEVRHMPSYQAADQVRSLVTLCIERYYDPDRATLSPG